MAKHWTYTNSLIQTVGSMTCMACGKPIAIIAAGNPSETGDYRFRETDDAFLPQHRACSADDPEWAAIDKRQQEYTAFYARRKATLKAYIDEFGPPDDDLVDEITGHRRT